MPKTVKQVLAEQKKQAERELAQKQAQPVAVVKPEPPAAVKPEPPAIVGDGWDDTDSADDRVIQGTLIKCVDGHWTDRDKRAIPPSTRLLALATHTVAAALARQPADRNDP